jgi:alkylation response protein AidB-like acyl-CoA dehydrogenase
MLYAPGDGFKGAMAGIDLARANVAAMCSGMMANSLEVALAYAAKRRAFGQRIVDFQGVQWQLADVATDLHASRLMAYSALDAIDAGEPAAIPAAHAKKFATRAALTGIAQCMQAMGADGYKHDFPLARHLACAKMAHYIDGSTEIQNVVISRYLLRPFD